MSKVKAKKPHFVNGLISDYRDAANAVDKDFIKQAIKESKNAKKPLKTSVFSKLSAKGAKKLLAL